MAGKSCEVKKKKEEQNNVVRGEYVHVNSHRFDNTPAQGLWLDHQTYSRVLRFRAAPDVRSPHCLKAVPDVAVHAKKKKPSHISTII